MKKENEIYHIYHVFGKKIGVTRNINHRLSERQGYSKNDYEIIDSSDDIDYISKRELELQDQYGYKKDLTTYKQVIKNRNKSNLKLNFMKLNVTDQTTTFPCPLSKLRGNLMDNLGIEITTAIGSYAITPILADWIVSNANVSMFNPNRCYVYNKALEKFNTDASESKQEHTEDDPNVYDLIRQWAKERGIYDKGDLKTQYIKLQEESGELAKAILKEDKTEFVDAIGDMVVVLTNLAALGGLKIEDCIVCAYEVIQKRKGKMSNGTFVKDNNSDTVTGSKGTASPRKINAHLTSTL